MIVCNCRGASDRDVKAAIQAGAGCLSDLENGGIAGGDCGCCEDTLREMISDCATNPCPGCTRNTLAATG
jgi:bacterioferritin-associated ferredoxin